MDIDGVEDDQGGGQVTQRAQAGQQAGQHTIDSGQPRGQWPAAGVRVTGAHIRLLLLGVGQVVGAQI